MAWVIGLGLVALCIYLMTKRWFWIVVLFFSGLASLFAMIASIIHFQILAALGFFVLMGIFWGILSVILEW